MKVIEYKVFNIDNVQEAINQGWQPYGNPFTVDDGFAVYTRQAVVKYEEEK
jgi:hypothetical protein